MILSNINDNSHSFNISVTITTNTDTTIVNINSFSISRNTGCLRSSICQVQATQLSPERRKSSSKAHETKRWGISRKANFLKPALNTGDDDDNNIHQPGRRRSSRLHIRKENQN